MKIYDSEYNKEKINNEGNIDSSFEFGSTPHYDSESYADNKIKIRDEVNDNPTSNTEKKEDEEKRRDKKEKEESTKEQQSSHSNNHPSNSSTSTASSGSGAIGGVAVAAASAVVTVSCIGALVGLDLTGHKEEPAPSPDFGEVVNMNIAAFHNKIGYRFQLNTINGDEYVVSVSLNGEEVTKQSLQEGTNANYVTGLSETTTYDFTVTNVTKNNFVIYSEAVTTIAANEATATIDVIPDLEEGTFEVLLTYNYQDRNFDNFMLEILDSEEHQKVYELAATDDQQTVQLNYEGDDFIFDFNDPNGFTYSLFYLYEEEERYSLQNKIVFNTTAVPTFYTITLDPGLSTDEPITERVREGKSYYLPENPFTTPEGYLFKGWRIPGRTVDYDPWTRIVSYLDGDRTYEASFKIDDTIRFNSITISNEIDFTLDTFDITVEMDYSDPASHIGLMAFKIYNPNPEYRSEGRNISVNLYARESQTVNVENIPGYLNLCSGEEFEYEFLYSDYNTGETVVASSGTVTFVDSDPDHTGREAYVNNFVFDRVMSSSPELIAFWSCEYEDTFDGGYYDHVEFEFTPYDGGDAINVIGDLPQVSGGAQTISNLDYSSLDLTGTYRYKFMTVDKLNRKAVVDSGLVDFNNLLSHLSNFEFGTYYYEITGTGTSKVYTTISMSFADTNNTYGNLTLELKDYSSTAGVQVTECALAAHNGTQVVDISNLNLEALSAGQVKYSVNSSQEGYIIEDETVPYIYQGTTSVMPDIDEAMLTKYEISMSDPYFYLTTIKEDGNSGSLANPRLLINDEYTFNFDASSITSGLSSQAIEVMYDIEGVLEYLKNNKVTIVLQYDVMDGGSIDSSPTITLCSNTVFTVR